MPLDVPMSPASTNLAVRLEDQSQRTKRSFCIVRISVWEQIRQRFAMDGLALSLVVGISIIGADQ